jgi:hypothetical protein
MMVVERAGRLLSPIRAEWWRCQTGWYRGSNTLVPRGGGSVFISPFLIPVPSPPLPGEERGARG